MLDQLQITRSNGPPTAIIHLTVSHEEMREVVGSSPQEIMSSIQDQGGCTDRFVWQLHPDIDISNPFLQTKPA